MSEATLYATQHAAFDRLVTADRPQAIRALRRYFEPDAYDPKGFTGSAFHSYEMGDPNEFSPADIGSLALLGMGDVIAPVMLAFRDREFREAADAKLRQIPDGDPLHWHGPDVVADDSPAGQLFRQIKSIGPDNAHSGNRTTTAFKLLARKRPDLFPIADSYTMKYMGATSGIWDSTRTWLKDRTNHAQAIMVSLEAADGMSVAGQQRLKSQSYLRFLEVPMWMIAKGTYDLSD